MRIALLTYSTKPRGGVVHTLALAEALVRAGAQVDVWTLGRGGDETFFRPVAAGVGVHAVAFEARAGEGVGPRIVRSIDELGAAFGPARAAYDVVHAQDCISANAAMASGGCVRTIHHLDDFTTPELRACHERAVVRPSARICVSAAVAAEVRDGWGLTPTVIPNGVDAARFAHADPASVARWRARLGTYVLALGGIEPRKGTLDLLEAYAALAAPGVRLVLAGGETLFDYRDYRDRFDSRVAELGLALAPVELGVVPDADVPGLVAGAAIMGFCSTREGFGLAAMESLAAGVPVVARDLPVLREVYADTVAYGSDPASFTAALRRVLADPPDPAAGRALAASYTWDAAAAVHLAFYASSTPALPGGAAGA